VPFQSPDPESRPGWRPALEILAAGLAGADPAAAVRRHLRIEGPQLICGEARIDLDSVDRIFLVAAGKAATAMVLTAEEILGDRLDAGVAVTARGTERAARRTTIHAGGHPLPDPGSLMATRHIAKLLEHAGQGDLVIALISGGASALMELPAGRIPLIDIQSATSALLGSGAPIEELNILRKHLSRVKGGGLAKLAAPARLATLVLSDVVGSRLDVIASGPTVPDPSSYAEAAAIIAQRDLWRAMPASIGDHLRKGMAGYAAETPKPGDPLFDRVSTSLIGDNASAAEAAAEKARALGYETRVLTTWLEGEAREAGRFLAALGKELAARGQPLTLPACYILGGETTVTLRRLGGSGGRNQELALAAALALDDPRWSVITLAAMGTDGIDGMTEAAGALVDGTSAARARAAGLDPAGSLDRHDSATYFAALGDRIVCGPTGTNVNDLALVLVDRA
jgi:hydroxypyruvate reductase